MESWKLVKLKGIAEIQKVISEFEIFSDRVPYGKFKVKVIEKANGSFIGTPNIALKNSDGIPEWVSGLGTTANEALEDCLKYFLESMMARNNLSESDFEWSAPEDF